MKAINLCSTPLVDFSFRVRENGKSYILSSTNKIHCTIVDIDNCVFENEDIRRCDYLFLIDKRKEENKNLSISKSKAIYVELKGIDIKDACQQLYNAIDKTKHEILNHDINAKVVGTKGFQPNIANNKYYLNIKRLIKKDIQFHKVHKGNNFTFTDTLN